MSYATHAMGPALAKREGKDCDSHKGDLWRRSMGWILLSSAQTLFQDVLRKSKLHFRGAHHSCGGADGHLALEKVPKGLGGPKRSGALKRKPHRWLHSCHGQIKAHDEFCHLKIFGMERSPLMVRCHCASLRMANPESTDTTNTSKDVESEQCSLSLVGCTVGTLEDRFP